MVHIRESKRSWNLRAAEYNTLDMDTRHEIHPNYVEILESGVTNRQKRLRILAFHSKGLCIAIIWRGGRRVRKLEGAIGERQLEKGVRCKIKVIERPIEVKYLYLLITLEVEKSGAFHSTKIKGSNF